MSLELDPETERRVREYAAAEGLSIDALLSRHFPPRLARQESGLPFLRTARAPQSGAAPSIDPHKMRAELLARWVAEDAQMTEAVRAIEQRQWEDYERSHAESAVTI